MEILGLIDTLESVILDSFKIPLTGKSIVDEAEILSVIDKIRLVCQSGADFAKKAIETGAEELPRKDQTKIKPETLSKQDLEEKAVEIIQEAYKIAKEVRNGANRYADEVLSNLEVTSNRVLRTIRNGRTKIGGLDKPAIDEEKSLFGELIEKEIQEKL